MGFTSSHNSTFQSRDCSSELDFATLRIKPSLRGSRVLADTIGQHVDQVSVDISANTRPTYHPCIGQHDDGHRSPLNWLVCQTMLNQHSTETLLTLRCSNLANKIWWLGVSKALERSKKTPTTVSCWSIAEAIQFQSPNELVSAMSSDFSNIQNKSSKVCRAFGKFYEVIVYYFLKKKKKLEKLETKKPGSSALWMEIILAILSLSRKIPFSKKRLIISAKGPEIGCKECLMTWIEIVS